MTDKTQAADTKSAAGKLGLFALIAIVVGSMLGGGVFSLPQNTAATSAIGPVIIAWIIAGIGMYFVANAFRMLSDMRPDLQAGVYMYAQEGFGAFIGFIVAWGYWLMTCFGNVAFAVILMDSLDLFFPGVFTDGNNLTSIICGSILIWGYNFLVLSGTKTAGFINTIGTVAKLVPLIAFVILLGVLIDYYQLFDNFWGTDPQIVNEVAGHSVPVTLAAQIMQSEMENIRLLNWAQLTALPASETVDIASIVSSGSSSTLDATLNNIISKFTCERTITTPKTDMREVTLTISWNGQDGRGHSNSYVTRYCKNGLYDFYYTAH